MKLENLVRGVRLECTDKSLVQPCIFGVGHDGFKDRSLFEEGWLV